MSRTQRQPAGRKTSFAGCCGSGSEPFRIGPGSDMGGAGARGRNCCLFVFGSVARGEARPDSDIDFLVEFARPTGLLGFTRLRLMLERVFRCPIDLGTKNGLRPSIRQHALAEAVRVA